MQNHYSVLGLKASATQDEIRRAYRVLARRYHPDLNPGRASEEKFKAIAEAYAILSEPEKRKDYDAEFDKGPRTSTDPRLKAYQRQSRPVTARERFFAARESDPRRTAEKAQPPPPRQQPAARLTPAALGRALWREFTEIMPEVLGVKRRSTSHERRSSANLRVSVIEISISIGDAILGVKRTVSIEEPEGIRKVSVRIPAGTRSGSVIRMRSTSDSSPAEELVLVVRVAPHPFLSIQGRGLTMEVPVSINEAICGASLSIPTLEDSVVLRIPPGSQSGTELRVKGKGIAERDGKRGDLIVRLLIKTPENPEAVGLRDKGAEIDRYYSTPVRQGLPASLLEALS